MTIKKRIYKPGDIAECFTYALNENQTTHKFHLRLIKKIEDLDEHWGSELWAAYNSERYSKDILYTPLEELDWDEIGEPQEYNIVTNEEVLAKLNRMARDGASWRELLNSSD